MWVEGDSVALGYFQDRDKSWSTFHGRWCRTGDLFRIDEEGYLWFSGRADDLLKVGGLWCAPVEVEDCLMHHPAVSLAAVIGSDDDGLTKPKAFIVLRDDARARATSDDARAALAEELKGTSGTVSRSTSIHAGWSSPTTCPRTIAARWTRRRSRNGKRAGRTREATDHDPPPRRSHHGRARADARVGPAAVALVPVGSVEPHGPHLPLATDTLISEAAAERAASLLGREGLSAFVAPAVPYGVTRFAEGFAGAISVPAAALTAFVRAVIEGYLEAGSPTSAW